MKRINIRSITYTLDLEKITLLTYQKQVINNFLEITKQYESFGIKIRTLRVNVLKIDEFPYDERIFIEKIKVLSSFITQLNVRWFNIAFDLSKMNNKNQKRVISLSYYILRTFNNSFINLIVTEKNTININACKEASTLIKNVSKISTNGYDNFRLGISVNPSVYTPFFPFSYSISEHSFSLALEITELFYSLIGDKNSINEIKGNIHKYLGEELVYIQRISLELNSNDIFYRGLDCSLAPYPDENISVVDILRKMGLEDIGSAGSIFLTSIITDIIKYTLKKFDIKSVGFNGVMYSLLEDTLLSKANNKKLLSIEKLLGYSTMCGCGLDMIPVPGNILNEELTSIIIDTAAISLKLYKPLGVRLLPIPNKDANEYTEFDMDFLTNTKIMDIKNLYYDEDLLNNHILEYDNFS